MSYIELIKKHVDKANQLVDAMRILHSRGLINIRGGNGSIKVTENEILITPSGLPKHLLRPEDLVVIRLDGSWHGRYKPTIEYRMHLEIYRRIREARAVLHAHNPYTILAVELGIELNPKEFVETRYAIGECIGVVDEVEPGTEELAKMVGDKAEKCKTIILRRHGVVAYGETIYHALDAIEALEDYAKIIVLKQILKRTTSTS